jgi:hypothetical protein
MLKTYHRAITTQALNGFFSPAALECIILANLGQDHWLYGQIGHPEYHFDQNAFLEGLAYIERNRMIFRSRLEAGDNALARQALGRLTHAAQDFYAHSNYVALWLGRFLPGQPPPPAEIDALDEALLKDPDLRSGKIYWPFEPFSWIPGLARIVVPLLPRDSHAWMNLDSPARGPGFAYAFAAAVKRTLYEYQLTVTGLPPSLVSILSRDDHSLVPALPR